MDGHPIGVHRKLGRDQGMRKILPQAYGGYSEDKIFRITQISNQISGKLAIYGWAIVCLLHFVNPVFRKELMLNFQSSQIHIGGPACGKISTPPMRRIFGRPLRLLAFMVTPEATDSPSAITGSCFKEARRMGAVKSVFWVAVSIGISLTLSIFCK